MKRLALRAVPVVALLVAGLAVMPQLSGQSTGQPSTANGEWPMYTADLRGSKYSPLDQINSTNFSKLEVAWRFKTDNLGPRPETKLEGTPLMVKGMLYATAGTRRAVVALDPRTGEQKWMYWMDEGERATRWAPRQLSGRGLSYWTDGKGDERILYVTTGYRWSRSTPRPACRSPASAQNGIVDLKVGVMIGRASRPISRSRRSACTRRRPSSATSSSSARRCSRASATSTAPTPRASSARSTSAPASSCGGSTRCPAPASPVTRPGKADRGTGPATPACGRRSPPIRRPASSTCRSSRRPSTSTAATGPGNNLYAESLVAVDLKTGQHKWHFQFVHHPIWDHDMSSAPLLVDTTVDGTPRKLVAVPSKQGWLYVFDRITGEPIWPIEERPVPQSTMPGEKTRQTQPFSTKPPAYSRTHVAETT